MSKGKARVGHNKSNSCVRSRYVQERPVKDLNKGWSPVRGIEANERVVCTPLCVACTHDIIIEGVNVLSMLALAISFMNLDRKHTMVSGGNVKSGKLTASVVDATATATVNTPLKEDTTIERQRDDLAFTS